jgi:hypothetical protein
MRFRRFKAAHVTHPGVRNVTRQLEQLTVCIFRKEVTRMSSRRGFNVVAQRKQQARKYVGMYVASTTPTSDFTPMVR